MAQVPYVNEATYLNVLTLDSVTGKGNRSKYPKKFTSVCLLPIMIHLKIIPSPRCSE